MAAKEKKRKFGTQWRVSMENAGIDGTITSHNEVILDEVVLEGIIHIEMMDDNHYWVRVGDHVLNVVQDKKGGVTVTHELDDYKPEPAPKKGKRH